MYEKFGDNILFQLSLFFTRKDNSGTNGTVLWRQFYMVFHVLSHLMNGSGVQGFSNF